MWNGRFAWYSGFDTSARNFIATSLAYGPVAADGERSGLGAAISMAGGGLPDLVEPGEPPSLLFHGDQDTRAPFPFAPSFCDTANDVGVDCTLVVYEGRQHVEVSDGCDLSYDIWQTTAEFLVDVFDLETS